MKKAIIVTMFLISILASVPAFAQQDMVEEVIVTINDEMITLSEFQRYFAPVKNQLESRYEGEELARQLQNFKKQVFNILINKKLLRTRFTEMGFSFGENIYQTAYEYFMRQLQVSTMQELEQALAENGMTLQSVRTIAEENFVERVLFSREIFAQVDITESSIQEYYEKNSDRYSTPEKVSISQIVITFTPSDKQIKKAVAEEAVQRARGGEDFDTVYRNVTPGVGIDASASIGEVESTSLRSDLAEAISSLSEGDVSDVIELESAFVVIKIDTKTPRQLVPLEEIRDLVEEHIRTELLQDGLDKIITRYKEEFFIKIRNDEFRELYDPESTQRSFQGSM